MKWQWVRRLTAREKIMLQILAVVAFFTLTTVYGILPKIVEGSQLDEQIAAITLTNSRLMAKARQASEIDSELSSIQQKLDRLAVQLPSKKELPQFIVTLEQMAAGSKIRLREIRLGEPVDKETHGEIPVDLSLSGEYLSLVQFVKQLETMPRHTRSTQWRITASSSSQLEMQISMVILIDRQALKQIEGDTPPGTYPIGRANPFTTSSQR